MFEIDLKDGHGIFVNCPGNFFTFREGIFMEYKKMKHELSHGHIAHCEYRDCHTDIVRGSMSELAGISLLLAVYQQQVLSIQSNELFDIADWAIGEFDSWFDSDIHTWKYISDLCILYYKVQSFLDENIRIKLRD